MASLRGPSAPACLPSGATLADLPAFVTPHERQYLASAQRFAVHFDFETLRRCILRVAVQVESEAVQVPGLDG